EWDIQSVEKWVMDNLHTAEARDLAALAIRGVYGEEAAQISLLDLLSAVSGVGGDFNTLIGDAQTIRFVGGPQQLSLKLAAGLGRTVRRHSAVLAIDRRSAPLRIHTAKHTFRARSAILTPPKP